MSDVRAAPRRGLRLAVPLGLLATAYLGLGFVLLVFETPISFPVDLRLRWVETRLLMNGIDPQLAGHPDPDLPEQYRHEGMVRLGGSYPPWSYTTGLVLVTPGPWPAVRVYSAVLNLAAVIVLGRWAYVQARRFDRAWRWAAVAAPLAMFPVSICVSYGQYAVVTAGCLAAVALLFDRRALWADALAGLLLGVALVKPQLGGLFAIAVVLERRWVCAGVCIAYTAAAAGVAALLAGSDPITMFSRSASEAEVFSFLSHNALVPWLRSVFDFKTTTALMGGGGLLLATGLMLAARGPDRRLVRWAVAAAVAMFWSYRRHYDVPVLSFLLVALLVAALSARSPARWAVFFFVGLTVWLPMREPQWKWAVVQIGDLVIWLGAVVLLVVWTRSAAGNPGGALAASPACDAARG